jgi:hypothetical protein
MRHRWIVTLLHPEHRHPSLSALKESSMQPVLLHPLETTDRSHWRARAARYPHQEASLRPPPLPD